VDPFITVRGRLLSAGLDLAPTAVVREARLADLVPDSMIRLDLITDVLEELGITGPLRDFAHAATVGELTDLLAGRIA
jgi:acyl carrier protein